MSLFVDIGALNDEQTDRALNTIYKAIHDHGDDEIWAEHPSPFIRRLVELFTERGLMRIEAFRKELTAWLRGERHTHGGVTMPRPEGAMQRWSPEELGLVRLYLETLPPERWTVDDHMMMVDYLVQRYLPEEDLRTEAEWLATRATLMGRVQANMEKLSARQADTVLAALPVTVAQARMAFNLPQVQLAVMDFARVHAAENVRKLTDDVRHRMRRLIADDLELKALRIQAPDSSLQTKLLDEFATLNRDWRRIAVTEAGNAQTQGYIASLPAGSKVKRIEQYKGRCSWCAKIDGREFNVVDAADPNKDGETDVWPGKTNIGRAAAPRKRVGALLVEREPHEMWWVAAGTQHPHCRGRWLPVLEDQPGDDKEFGAWLRQHLTGARGKGIVT